MSVDTEAKAEAIAKLIDGKIVDDDERVALAIKGLVYGFPCSIEAIGTGWPFGTMMQVHTNLPDVPRKEHVNSVMRMTIYPRMGRGLMSIFTKIVLFESKGLPVGDKRLEKVFNFDFDNSELAERLIRYPNVPDILVRLEQASKFSELIIKSDAGVYLSVPTSFNSLDIDVTRASIKTLGELAQVLFDAF